MAACAQGKRGNFRPSSQPRAHRPVIHTRSRSQPASELGPADALPVAEKDSKVAAIYDSIAVHVGGLV